MVDNLYDRNRQDQMLVLGAEVIVRWVADGYSYSGRALIIGLKSFSVKVSLTERVGPNERYPIGKQLEFPRYCDQTRWSPRNCVQVIGKGNDFHNKGDKNVRW